MRVIAAGALGALALEALLALAFWGGWAWLGGATGGFAAAAVLAIALALLAAGDVEVVHDSGVGLSDVRLGWLARITRRSRGPGGTAETRIRVLCVAWTQRDGAGRARPGRPPRTPRRAIERLRALRDGAEPAARALTAAAPALHDLMWDARELSVRVQSPTRLAFADRALARWIGHRRLGPADIRFADGETREFAVRYRIGLARAALTLIAATVQAQPQRLARALRRRDAGAWERGGVAAGKEAG